MKNILIILIILSQFFITFGEEKEYIFTDDVKILNNFNEVLPEIKTFLRDNYKALNYIENNKFLQKNLAIKNFDKEKLAKIFANINHDKLEEIKNKILRINKDVLIQEKLSRIVDLVDIENNIDSIERSIDIVGEYDLNREIKENLEKKKNQLIIQINNIEKQIKPRQNSEELQSQNKNIVSSNIKLVFLIFLLLGILGFGSYKYIQIRKFKKLNPQNIPQSKILQILKNKDEYTIEYEGIYNKGLKVLENTKKSITSSIDSFIYSTNKLLKNRGILEDLNNIDIDIPNLESSGGAIYRLFISDSIKQKLEQQKESLIIKTDEQEIPWEIMHTGNTFLSLKFPISRQIMTRETIKQNKEIQNKKGNILFITNPTGDLPGSEKEIKEIISKLQNKMEIKVLIGKNACLVNVLTELSKNNYDIIHYSGHAYFDEKKADESGLILHGNQILSNTEIKRLISGSPLIFLNACSSGKGLSDEEEYYNITGEDSIGLASSFIIGGAKGVISTLWPISDIQASFFAGIFYSFLLKRENIGKSILEAKKQTYMNNQKDPTWASFIYYGNPNLKINLK